MVLKERFSSEPDLLDQLAGITGVGWTVSVLGYLGSLIGYGNSILTRVFTEPQSLLYVGGVFFVVTVGIDRFRARVLNRDS